MKSYLTIKPTLIAPFPAPSGSHSRENIKRAAFDISSLNLTTRFTPISVRQLARRLGALPHPHPPCRRRQTLPRLSAAARIPRSRFVSLQVSVSSEARMRRLHGNAVSGYRRLSTSCRLCKNQISTRRGTEEKMTNSLSLMRTGCSKKG